MADEYFRGYPKLTQTIAGFKKGAELVKEGTLFSDLKTSAAVVDCLVGGTFAVTVGAPDGSGSLFGAPGSEERNDLKTAQEDFVSAVEAKKANLEKEHQRLSASGSPVVGAPSPSSIMALIMALIEFIKSMRS